MTENQLERSCLPTDRALSWYTVIVYNEPYFDNGQFSVLGHGGAKVVLRVPARSIEETD